MKSLVFDVDVESCSGFDDVGASQLPVILDGLIASVDVSDRDVEVDDQFTCSDDGFEGEVEIVLDVDGGPFVGGEVRYLHVSNFTMFV